ncbi:MAG: hypothetical protein E7477_03805 [Ruminococcaceae bacterium]|nr:hypothetical protein [Oscillospiraceae bacterium]
MLYTFKTRNTEIGLNENGYFSSINVCGEEIALGNSPIVTVCFNDELYFPEKAVVEGKSVIVTTAVGELVLAFSESDVCVNFEVKSVPDGTYAIIFGPVSVNINDVVGEIIGVIQGKGVAFGAQSLNIKTVEGYPAKYNDKMNASFDYSDESSGISVGSADCSSRTAAKVNNGAIVQLYCRRRDQIEYLKVSGVENSLVLPLAEGDPDAVIPGAKIAFFGCKAENALERIGEIEVEQGLPHPIIEGEWGKVSRGAMRSYLISDFDADSFDLILDKAKTAGLQYVYHEGPQKNWGHFEWSESLAANNEEARKLIDKAAEQGISVGVHTLTNFTTTNDPYVTPVPSEHLLKMCAVKLVNGIDASQTEIVIEKAEQFKHPLTLNTVQIGNELITYSEYKDDGENAVLTSCVRGAFGTTASEHNALDTLYRLWDYPYRTLFPDIILQDEFCKNLAKVFNECDLKQISYDGLEGCSYTGHDTYATTRFVYNCWNGYDHNVINDASRLQHFNWHIHSRMNWGEPWGEAMRTGQVEGRIRNQAFFRRNLFPRMLGWFLIRLADKKFECSTLEDVEWAMSEAAGFDGGYAMTIRVNTLKKHGKINELLTAMKNWDKLRLNNVFTEEQKAKLRLPETEWHLEDNGNGEYSLYPVSVSKRYTCDLSELQPGQPGGADWSVDNPYPGNAAFCLKVDGDGSIRDIMIKTSQSTVKFDCEVEDGQYLIFGFDGKAEITDKNFKTIEKVEPQGELILPAGNSSVAFSCGHDKDSTPDVVVRFITRGTPEIIKE